MKKIFFVLMFVIILVIPSAFAATDIARVKATLLNQDPDPAEPGQYVELRWKIEKLGNGAIEDIRYKLEADYPFSFDKSDSDTKTIGGWNGFSGDDEYYTLYYKLRVDDDALEDTYQIKLLMNHEGTASWIAEEYDVRVGENLKTKFVLGSIITSPSKLTADLDEAEIQIDLENIGDGDAENVKVELELPEGFTPSYSYADVNNMGTIEAGQGETGLFYFDISDDLNGGDYSAKAKISYKDSSDEDNEYKIVTLPFMIHLKDQPKFEVVSFETNPKVVYAGSQVDVKIVVKNTGGDEGDSVSLRAFKESSQPFDFDEKSDFIGKLAPGETGEAILKLTVDKNANPKEYNLDLEIRSIDGDQVLINDDQFTLKISEGKNEEKLTVSIVMLIIVAIVTGVIGYFIGKRKKSKK